MKHGKFVFLSIRIVFLVDWADMNLLKAIFLTESKQELSRHEVESSSCC